MRWMTAVTLSVAHLTNGDRAALLGVPMAEMRARLGSRGSGGGGAI